MLAEIGIFLFQEIQFLEERRKVWEKRKGTKPEKERKSEGRNGNEKEDVVLFSGILYGAGMDASDSAGRRDTTNKESINSRRL